MRVRKRLGEMLVESGLLTEEGLSQALDKQKGSGLRLGDFLIDKDIVPEERIIDMLSSQLQIRKFNADEYEITPELAKIIDNDQATKYRLVPLCKNDFILTVAMVDPMDIQALDALEKNCDIEVEPVICSKSQLSLLTNGIYGIHSEVKDILQKIDDKLTIETIDDNKKEDFSDLKDMVDAAPVIRLVNSILRQAVAEKASDIHIGSERTGPWCGSGSTASCTRCHPRPR